jgi:hypothetical protein
MIANFTLENQKTDTQLDLLSTGGDSVLHGLCNQNNIRIKQSRIQDENQGRQVKKHLAVTNTYFRCQYKLILLPRWR